MPYKKLILLGIVMFCSQIGSIPEPIYANHLANSSDRIEIHGGDDVTYLDVLNTLNSYAIPLSPLSKGVKEFKVTPAYLSVSNNFQKNDDKATGFGVAISWLEGLSPHFGYSVLGAYGQLSGDTVGMREYTNSNMTGVFEATDQGNGTLVATQKIDKKGYGIRGAVALVYDPFTKPKGFRLPILLGFGALYMDQESKGTLTSSVRGNQQIAIDVSHKELVPGYFLGISAQFNTGPFRWIPFFTIQTLLGQSPSQTRSAYNATTGEQLIARKNESGDTFFPSMGIGVQYQPWGLSLSYNPNFYEITAGSDEDEPSVSIFSFTKTFSWGAAKEEGVMDRLRKKISDKE